MFYIASSDDCLSWSVVSHRPSQPVMFTHTNIYDKKMHTLPIPVLARCIRLYAVAFLAYLPAMKMELYGSSCRFAHGIMQSGMTNNALSPDRYTFGRLPHGASTVVGLNARTHGYKPSGHACCHGWWKNACGPSCSTWPHVWIGVDFGGKQAVAGVAVQPGHSHGLSGVGMMLQAFTLSYTQDVKRSKWQNVQGVATVWTSDI